MTCPSYVQPGTSLRSVSICARARAGVPAGRGLHFLPASVDMFRLLGLLGVQPRDAQQRRRGGGVKKRGQKNPGGRAPAFLVEREPGARKGAGGGESCRVGVGPEFMGAGK